MMTVKNLKDLLASMPEEWDQKEIVYRMPLEEGSYTRSLSGEVSTPVECRRLPWNGSEDRFEMVVTRIEIS
jgi:hypothetical protein